MLTDETRRSRPHEVRPARPGPPHDEPGAETEARGAHRLRRIRKVPAQTPTDARAH
ncbi:hypothetical protein SAMN05421811_11963 [Nonomuraea wenchangensis]|uniref:Uncharacterized protein n=1 Tax=Nonomuraea wenchangensis TaxID=568860 RepID=A0A1I0LMT0_9ACTN|nr:hypothetical protein SAMN05421811_11963 [Nonomuraea wenchangensis]